MWHNAWFTTTSTVGIGFTVMVKVVKVPVQVVPEPVNVGVTVMVAVTGALVVLETANKGILPVPAIPRPMEGVLLTQL